MEHKSGAPISLLIFFFQSFEASVDDKAMLDNFVVSKVCFSMSEVSYVFISYQVFKYGQFCILYSCTCGVK